MPGAQPETTRNEESLEPRLPPELEREIFELALASATVNHDPRRRQRYEGVLDLLTVAKRVSHWVESAMYSTMVIMSPEDPDASPFLKVFIEFSIRNFKQSTAPNLKSQFNGRQLTLVKHIMVWDSLGPKYPADIIANLIERCPNVMHLALWGDSRASIEAQAISRVISTRQTILDLSIIAPNRTFPQSPKNTVLAKSLRRLDVTNMEAREFEQEWSDLFVSLPQLTHLAVGGRHIVLAIERVLKDSESLVMLIVTSNTSPPFNRAVDRQQRFKNEEGLPGFIKDPRIVFVRYPDDSIRAWKAGANGRGGLWAMGKRAQEMKRKASNA